MDRLSRFPAAAFGVSLGTAGQAALWNQLTAINATGPLALISPAPAEIGQFFWVLASTLICLTVVIYLAKMIKRWQCFVREFRSSIDVNFFFMPFLVIMVLGGNAPRAWITGGVMHVGIVYTVVVAVLAFEVYLYAEWMYGVTRSLAWANPAYQLAIVASIIAAGLAAKAGEEELSIFLFGVGMFYWMLTMTALHTVRNEIALLDLEDCHQPVNHSPNSPRAISYFPHPAQEASNGSLKQEENGAIELVDMPTSNSISSDQRLSVVHQGSSVELLSNGRRDSCAQVKKRYRQTVNSSVVESPYLNPWSPDTPSWSLPTQLHPTMFLFVAPPSLAASSWASIQQDSCTELCQMFASIAFFFFLVNIAQLPRYIFKTPISFAFWAFTFPSSALALAAIDFTSAHGSTFVNGLSLVLVFLSIFLYTCVCTMTVFVPIWKGTDLLLLPETSKSSGQHKKCGSRSGRPSGPV